MQSSNNAEGSGFQCINNDIESFTGMDEFNLRDHSRYFPLKAQGKLVTKQILSSEIEQMIIYKTWQRVKNHLLVETPWKKLPNTPSSIYKAPLCLLMTGSVYRLILYSLVFVPIVCLKIGHLGLQNCQVINLCSLFTKQIYQAPGNCWLI